MRMWLILLVLFATAQHAYAEPDKSKIIKQIIADGYLEEAFDMKAENEKMRKVIASLYKAKDKKPPAALDTYEFFTKADVEKISEASIKAMGKLFSYEELVAMQKFYATPEGRSILKKSSKLIEGIQPVLVGLMAQKQFEMKTTFSDLE